MRWGVLLAIVLLLVVPAVFAAGTTTASRQCGTRYDCVRLLGSAQVTCEPGFIPNYVPLCEAGKCAFCKPMSTRIAIDCRVDSECSQKTKCSSGLFARCIGRKCVCTSQAKVECYTNNDCTRTLVLGRNYQKLVCLRGKCVAPQPMVTMLPWYAVPANYTAPLPKV